ncbi:hypothetical protein [Streptomyces adelaidensis]|jgi:hypothetical protein|uniref:hypothetical protein n=1 Tax=Streptomyces adelaidensis TaxID=2796465 RepID=UPI0019058BA5|nr:hypothetical protein [Streptomyces adelaidensis]
MDRLRLPKKLVWLLVTALSVGAGAGVLSTLAGDGAARSVLCGLAALGGTVQVLHLVLAHSVFDDAGTRRRPRTKADDRRG